MIKTAAYYLTVRLFSSLADWIIRFLYFWFIEGPLSYWRKAMFLVAGFEDLLAVKITLQNLFAPLYQDYSIIGRIIGPFFRIGRVIVGIFFLGLILATETAIFLVLCVVIWGAPLFFIINLFIWNQ